MNCAEFKEQVGALALGALEPAEEAACAEHLEAEPVHHGCHEAYARALVTAGKLATSLTPVRPGARVWAGIEAALDGESRTAARPRRWPAAAGWAVAVAAAIALVLLYLDRDRRVQLLLGEKVEVTHLADTARAEQLKCMAELNAVKDGDQLARDAVALADKPGSQLVPMSPQPGQSYHATIIYNPGEKRAYVVSATMAPITGKDFELWVIRDAKTAPIEAGLMRTRQGQVAVGAVDARVLESGAVFAIAMSLEPSGGSPNGKPSAVLLVGPVKG
ncbi:MAG TPA: anti-sigma factor [Myxococcales bacterium]|nr:anti-sigma factor [Myxococcales bacterium]